MYCKKILWIGFALMVLLQLWAPVSMIFNRQSVLKHGKAYKFRSAPVDPNDPFRGKYIVLRYDAASFKPLPGQRWDYGEKVFVALTEDSAGFARIENAYKEMPAADSNVVTANVSYLSSDSLKAVFIEWPFERFYMEEDKAYKAEQAYNKAAADSSQRTYALVKIKNGESVLQNVFINEIPIVDYIKIKK